MGPTDKQLMVTQPRPILLGSTNGENLTSTGIRPYTLNRQQALDTKLQNCQSEHLQYVMKAGKNLVLNLSTAAFEFFRQTLAKLFTEQSKDLYLYVESTENTDLSGAIVDTCHKVRNLRKDGAPGVQNRFTINMYRTQSSVLVNGPKVDIFIEQFLKPIEALIDANVDSLTEKNQLIKGALSLPDSTSLKTTRPAIENNKSVAPDHADPLGNLSTNSEETLFKCSHCFEDVDEGIQCDECQQWNHCSCESVSNELFQLYNLQEAFYSCLSCRLLADDDLAAESMNSILTDGLSMRDPEGDDYVSQPLSRPATPTTPNSDNLPVTLDPGNGLRGSTNGSNMVARSTLRPATPSIPKRDNSTEDHNIHGQHVKSVDVDNLVSQTLSSSFTGSTTRDIPQASTVSPRHSQIVISTSTDDGPDPQRGRKKKPNPANKKGNKKDDSSEQLSHAKSVIYSLEKTVEDMNVSNRLLTEELSLLRRLNPQPGISDPSEKSGTVTCEPTGQGCAHSGHKPNTQTQMQYMPSNGSHIGRSLMENIAQTGLCDYRHALQSSELELKLLRDRQHALELEHLKHRLAQVEQVNLQLNFTTNMLLHNQMNNTHPNNVTSMHGNYPFMPRQVPSNMFSNYVQPNLYPTLVAHPNLHFMNPMGSVLPITAIPGTRPYIHPMNYYNMVRPVQLQNIPPPAAQNYVNSRVSQPVTRNHNPVGGSVPGHQQMNAQVYIPHYTSIVPTNDVQQQCREDVLQPDNHNLTGSLASSHRQPTTHGYGPRHANIISDKNGQQEQHREDVPQKNMTPINETETRNHLSVECSGQGELVAVTSSPRSPSEIQVIDPDLNSTRASQTENDHTDSTSTRVHPPANLIQLQDVNSSVTHGQTPNGTMTQDACDQIPSTSSSQSFLGAGRATEATAQMEELQLQLSMLKI